ncbi:MAG: hypothetical protein ACPH4G_04580 [Henriciella sp.]
MQTVHVVHYTCRHGAATKSREKNSQNIVCSRYNRLIARASTADSLPPMAGIHRPVFLTFPNSTTRFVSG